MQEEMGFKPRHLSARAQFQLVIPTPRSPGGLGPKETKVYRRAQEQMLRLGAAVHWVTGVDIVDIVNTS